MPSNFDLTTLNGVRFTPDQIAAITSASTGSGPIKVVVDGIGPVTHIGSAPITNATNSYTTPPSEMGYTFEPILGTIQIGTQTFNVFAFGDDEILIGQGRLSLSTGNYGGAYQYGYDPTVPPPPGWSPSFFILSSDAIQSSPSDLPVEFQVDAQVAGYEPPPPYQAPYDISTLNGATFDGAHVGYLPGSSSQALGSLRANQAWAINDPRADYSGGRIHGAPIIYGFGDRSTASHFTQTGTGAITVVNDYYYPASTNSSGLYSPPRFGQISLGSVSGMFEIRGFGEDGRSILIAPTGRGSTNDMFVSGAYVLSLDTLQVYTAANPPAGTPYQFGSDVEDIDAFAAAVCFAEGTRIATPHGLMTVETLAEGGMVLTAGGAVRPIKWIGQMLSRPARHPRPSEVQPVRVTADAFAPGCPAQDVRLSPGHAVYVDGVLVPVGNLINGATIVQEEVEKVRYFHIELDSHDVLLAEGLPCESYLDDGNRRSFANAGTHAELHGRLDPKSWDDACAPMIAAGPQLVELQQRLHARAEALGWTKTEEADLAILADGAEIGPVAQDGNRFRFNVPTASSLTLRSNRSVLAHVMPGVGDGRILGVAVAELSIDGVALPLEDAAFGAGFHPAERHEAHGWRWTDGSATIARRIDAPASVEISLAMVAPSWTRPAVELQRAANQ